MIEYAIEDSIGIIRLVTAKDGSISSPVFAEFHELEDFLNSSKIRALVIENESRIFCTGANIESIMKLTKDGKISSLLDDGKKLLDLIRNAPVPTAAIIRGGCFGAGLEIANAFHFIFASNSAMFGFPESNHLLMPGFSGTVLMKDVNKNKLLDLVLSGRVISSDEAMSIGLVYRRESTKIVRHECLAYLQSLVQNRTRRQIELILKSVNNSYTHTQNDALKLESLYFEELANLAYNSISDIKI